MKQKMSIAAEQNSPKNWSHNHYTTLGFGNVFPIFSKEVFNKNKLTFKVGSFAYASKTFVPTYTNINIKLHAFYVPYRFVWDHYENFKEGLPSWNSQGSQLYQNVPWISNWDLTNLFINYSSLAYVENNVSGNGFDFLVNNSTDPYDVTYYRFTLYGKQVYHILQGLGYRFNFAVKRGDGPYDRVSFQYFPLLPLLSYFKVFLDYYIPSQLQPSSYINQMTSALHDLAAENVNVEAFDGQTVGNSPVYYLDHDYRLIYNCFGEIIYYYNNNYFTSAWQSPNEPLQGLMNIGANSQFIPILNNVHQQGDSNVTSDFQNQGIYNNQFGTYSGSFAEETNLSADGISFLQKFAKFVRRSNYAGSRSVERILARFGVHVDDFNLGMSRYLGSDTVPIQMQDVTVNGNTEQAGELAGKPFAAGNDNRIFKVDCDLAGQIIVTASLECPSMYIDGIKREMFHMRPLDFYTPELDGAQMQAISKAELFSGDTMGLVTLGNNLSQFRQDRVFGFTPRYSEYCFEHDSKCGDFNVNTLRSNIDPYILERRFLNLEQIYDTIVDDPSEYVQPQTINDAAYTDLTKITPIDIMKGSDMQQFNRIFADTTGFADPFICEFAFNIICQSAKKPLDESAELIGRGKALEFETNGEHL